MTIASNHSAELSIAVKHYEILRRAALGDALPPEARASLLLFLRRGMWGWAHALVINGAIERPASSRPSNWKAPDEYRTVIHIFAAMAIRANHKEHHYE
jgi:hypothetical protein